MKKSNEFSHAIKLLNQKTNTFFRLRKEFGWLYVFELLTKVIQEYVSTLVPKRLCAHKCPHCNKQFAYYMKNSDIPRMAKKYNRDPDAGEMCNYRQYSCPYCGTVDRDRAVMAFLERNVDKQKQLALFHMAPSTNLKQFIEDRFPLIQQTTADLFMDNVDIKLDITRMPEVTEKKYNIFICIHVLEHVSDDRAAMRELYRVLDPAGFGILIVPINLKAQAIDEELGLSGEENWRRFGQNDHVRSYSHQGYVGRLEECGFDVQQAGLEYFGAAAFKQLGLSRTSIVYAVRRKNLNF